MPPVVTHLPLLHLVDCRVHELDEVTTVLAHVIPGDSLLLLLSGGDHRVTPHHRSFQNQLVFPVYLRPQHEVEQADGQVSPDERLDILSTHQCSLGSLSHYDSTVVFMPRQLPGS